ncbi:MAG: glycosyltransferase [Croceivirga sp.]|mgnify:CR=1 FL=1
MKKVAIVCNSNNAFFQSYYGALLDNINQDNVSFYGNKIFSKSREKFSYTISSYTNNAFLDIYSIIDFIIAPIIACRALFKGIKVIHFISAHPSNLPLALFARVFQIRTFFTIHDLIPHPDQKSKLVSLYNKVIVGFLATDIVVHNKEYLKQIKSKSSHFIQLSGYKEDFIEKDFNRKLLFFGRIEPYKGISNLFALAKRFQTEEMDWKIVIAGKGKLPQFDQTEIPNVEIFNDFISDSKLKEFHEECAFTILPYDSASQSAVIIHSYAFATPVIVYDVGALADYVIDTKTGLVVKHNDFDTIVNFLKKMDTFSFKSFQKSVKSYFSDHFSDRVFAKDTLRLYSEC